MEIVYNAVFGIDNDVLQYNVLCNTAFISTQYILSLRISKAF